VPWVSGCEPETWSRRDDGTGAPRLAVSVAHLTDVGRRRASNQDHHVISLLEDPAHLPQWGVERIGIARAHLLLSVADGMGGHFGGEVASALCLSSLTKELQDYIRQGESPHPELSLTLQKAVAAANRAIFEHAQTYNEKVTMGTTLTAALLHGSRVEIAQVGDSRAYLFRNGNLVLLTQDQTVANQLRIRGEDFAVLDAQVQDMLVQAMGVQEEIDTAMTAVELEPDDELLLSSDGLHKVVSPEEIVGTLELERDLPDKVRRLVASANDHGGPDNITALLARIHQV
jgi:serine/threonine protein phosphatase PrpC